MKLDHIAYRVLDLVYAMAQHSELGYVHTDSFKVDFNDGTWADCVVMAPIEFKDDPEVFLSQGSPESIVSNWVFNYGAGVHHLAYRPHDLDAKVDTWRKSGTKFLSNEILTCPGIRQIFTEVNPCGVIIELIERTGNKGFCQDNVKDLMLSTEEKDV